jgi:hypothetical protein
MVVIPELVLQKAIIGGLQALKADPRLMDTLFKNMSQAMLSDLKSYILKTSIDFAVNYPKKEQLNVPAVVLILRSESEAETFLGDFMGISGFNDVPDQDLSIDTLGGHGASVSDLEGLQSPLIQGLTVDGSEGTTVEIADDSLDEYQEVFLEIASGKCYKAYVVQGTGAGQVRTIISVSNTSLDTDTEFDTILDDTSVIDIREVGEVLAEGEPSRVYDPSGSYERIGVHYDTQYQLQVIAGHQEEVIYLYSIIKALLLSQRPFLEGQGMMVFKLSGSDFAPRGEYLPSDVFMRVLNIQFTYPFSFLRDLDVASRIEVCLTPDELNDMGGGIPILVGSFTIK